MANIVLLAETERPLIQTVSLANGGKFRTLMGDLTTPMEEFDSVSLGIIQAFDVDTAEGDQLDKIGAILNLPRAGYTDTRYRVFLKIQIDIYTAQNADRDGTTANWTGSHNGVLRIIRAFIGPTPGEDIVITPYYPYSFEFTLPLSVLPLPLEEYQLLFRFIRQAIYAAVLGYSEIGFDALVWGSDWGVVPSASIWGSGSGAVLGAGLWGGVFSTEELEFMP